MKTSVIVSLILLCESMPGKVKWLSHVVEILSCVLKLKLS